MFRRLLILSLSIIVVLALIAPISQVNASSKDMKINWKGTGTIVNNVAIMTNPGDPTSIMPHFLITISVHGAPGQAELTVLGQGGTPNFDPPPGDDCDIIVDIVQNEMVMRFSDGSFLFSIHDTS